MRIYFTTADDDNDRFLLSSRRGTITRSTNTYKYMLRTRCSKGQAYRFNSMNFIDEEYPRIYSPPSTKKPFRQRGLIAQDISTQSPSRNIHIKRTGSVIVEEAPLGANAGLERANNDFPYTPRNSYALSSSSKIPVQTPFDWYDDTSPCFHHPSISFRRKQDI